MDEQQIEVAVDGGTLVGHRGGDGLPALFLHGGPAMPDYMGTCAELPADRFAYVRHTRRGVAPSAEVPPYTIDLGIAIRNAPRRVGVECSTEANRSIAEHHAARTLVERLPKAPGRPALFVHGTEDPMPRESSIATAELIPDAQVVVIEASGHYPWLECPDAFRDAVVTWLDGRTS